MSDEGSKGPLTGLTPHLCINEGKAAEASDFYCRAFGGVEVERVMAEDGRRLLHAHLHINGASLMLHDDFPEMAGGQAAPQPAGVVIHLQVDDADAWFNRAVAAGGGVRLPIGDQFWGDRYGQLSDPYGYLWSIGAPIRR